MSLSLVNKNCSCVYLLFTKAALLSPTKGCFCVFFCCSGVDKEQKQMREQMAKIVNGGLSTCPFQIGINANI